jgi:hypothetical protein
MLQTNQLQIIINEASKEKKKKTSIYQPTRMILQSDFCTQVIHVKS